MARTLGAWDCSYCDNKKILGNIFDCPGCGHPRPRGVRFYQISDAPIVTPEIAEQLGSGGPNWYCLHCDSGNKDNESLCWQCGAEKGSSPSHEVKTYEEGEVVPRSTKEAEMSDPDKKSWVDTNSKTTRSEELVQSDEAVPNYPRAFPSELTFIDRAKDAYTDITGSNSFKSFLVALGIILGFLATLSLIYQIFFNTHQQAVQIDSFSWSQNVNVQEYMVVHDASWGVTPSDAYNVIYDYRDTGRDEKIHDRWDIVPYLDTCYRDVSYTDTCYDSVYVSKTCYRTTDNGDGSFSNDSYECGSSESRSYSCQKSRPEPYSCTKTREVEIYHFEDIYDYYFEFDIDRWMTVANYPTSGNNQKPYFYTDFTINDPYTSGNPRLGQQQFFQQPGTYSITFFCDNEKIGEEGYFSRNYSQEVWNEFNLDQNYNIETNFLNLILTDPAP